MNEERDWYRLTNPESVISPSLLVYPDRIAHNIDLMIAMVGDAGRLRPHIKTHKTAEIINMQLNKGITKFKCATIAEAELLGMCGVPDALLAMQPAGANILRYVELVKSFPQTAFSTIVDSRETISLLSQAAAENSLVFSLFLDLNTGMNRTGIIPGIEAKELYQMIWQDAGLKAAGLHAYDGHIRHEELGERRISCDDSFDKVLKLKELIEADNMKIPAIVVGGSPSFPIHVNRENVELSPGTTLLWDERYGSLFKDMEFMPAAVLFSRVISKPADGLICLDLGHKSIAPEMDFPRVRLLGMENCEQISQSEEHLVVRCPDSSAFKIGDICYAIPMHICPTVAKYSQLLVVENGEITDRWDVAARNQQITI